MKNETKVVPTRVTLRLAKLIEEIYRGDLHLNPADLKRARLRSKSWRQKVCQVDTASSVEEATQKMKEKTYDAVISEYMLPRKDGLEFLKELRGNGKKIPFIIFTGKGREEVAVKALNLGADRYFNKIGDPETVYSELAHGIRKAMKTRQGSER